MPRHSLFLLSLAIATLAAQARGEGRPDPDRAIARVLEVQNALYQGRQLLTKGDAKKAVEVLEAKLPYIDGNRDYLAALRDAYWAHLKTLQRAQQTDEVARVFARLRLLDPTAQLDGIGDTPGKAAALPPVMPAPKPRTELKARAQADESDPFQQTPLTEKEPARDLVRQAEAAFAEKRFADAEKLYARLNAADPQGVPPIAKGNWEYCILRRCVERINQAAPGDATTLDAVEHDVLQALSLAPGEEKLQNYGRTVLEKLREVRTAVGDWAIAESTNFRLHHRQAGELADRLLKQAEKARTEAVQKWFGNAANAWPVRCELYLHLSAEQYARSAKGLPHSHGHSTIEVKDGKVSGRRIDLAGDNPDLLAAAVPREVTHVVLADVFPSPLLPRWADEAMAILAEPRANVERYLQVLPRCRRDGQLVAVGPLLMSAEFPDPAAITAFYVESVSLVDMLVGLGGPKKFAIYLQDARRYGYEQALARNYQIRGFADLQERWQHHAFAAAP